jgi:hypothetical protein
VADAEILGLHAIAKHMGLSVPGLRALIVRDGFLVYKRRLHRVRPGCRAWCWATTPSLIQAWRIAKAKADRAELLAANRPSERVGRGR